MRRGLLLEGEPGRHSLTGLGDSRELLRPREGQGLWCPGHSRDCSMGQICPVPRSGGSPCEHRAGPSVPFPEEWLLRRGPGLCDSSGEPRVRGTRCRARPWAGARVAKDCVLTAAPAAALKAGSKGSGLRAPRGGGAVLSLQAHSLRLSGPHSCGSPGREAPKVSSLLVAHQPWGLLPGLASSVFTDGLVLVPTSSSVKVSGCLS